MGVNIRDLVKNTRKVIKLKDLTGKTIGIDAMNWIYQFLATIRGFDGQLLKDWNGNITSHLMGLFHRNLNLLEHGIKPAYIFDGTPSSLKRNEIEKRKKIKRTANIKMENALDDYKFDDAKKYAQGTSRLTKNMIRDAKRLIYYMGIPIIQAPHDGEALASRMAREELLWGVASQDYDCFLFGASRLVRNISISQTKKVGNIRVKTEIEYYNMKNVLDELGLTREQLVDLGILVGTDFWSGIKGVGVKTAFKLIQKHESIINMIENNTLIKKKPILNYLPRDKYEKIRAIFLVKEKTTGYKNKLKWKQANTSKIREILVDEHNFNPERVDKNMIQLKKNAKQTSIDQFFS